jgi:hypothetical protein
MLCLIGHAAPEPILYAAAGDVYCVTPGGGTYPACSQVFTHVQAAVDAATGGEEIRVAAGTYTGVRTVPSLNSDTFTATQVLVITKSVTLRGGYSTADWITADPAANPTTLDAQGQGRGLVISGTITPTVEGLRITGGDATRLGGSVWGLDGGGGAYVWEATPTISGCVIYSNTASTANPASGGGVFIRYGEATLSGNRVVGNTAGTGGRGSGGGLSLRGGRPILSGNTVVSNMASTAASGYGGGVCVRFGAATLSGNTVASNSASTTGWGYGGGVFVRRATATLNGNMVRGNVGSTGSGGTGGGLYLEIGEATLSGNIVVGNVTSPSSGGHGGGLGFYNNDVTLINNVVAGNQAKTNGSGLWFAGTSEDVLSGHLLHNTIAHNGASDGSGPGVFVGEYATLALTNTIIAGHQGVGISVTNGSAVTLEATLWHENGADTGGGGSISTGAVNVFGDPRFADPSAWDYHLTARSAAIDKGVYAGAITDIDGDERPQAAGYDMGADEYIAPYTTYLPLVLRSTGGLSTSRR